MSGEKSGHSDRLFLLMALLSLVAGRLVATILIHVYDDAFITMRYARNLAEGIGFVYNPGEWILGTTTPAFGVILSLFYRLGIPMPAGLIGLNILLDSVTLWMTWQFILPSVVALVYRRDEHESERPDPLLLLFRSFFAFLFTLSPILARTCVGGMETSLFLLVHIGTIVLYLRGRRIPSLMIAALSFLVRPEGVILIGIILLLELLYRSIRQTLLSLLIIAGTLAPFLYWIYSVYGHVLSQSVLAKSTLTQKGSPLNIFWSMIHPEIVTTILVVPALFGLFFYFRDLRERWCAAGEKTLLQNGEEERGDAPSWLVWLRQVMRYPVVPVALWVALYMLAYLIGRPKFWSWYGEPVYYGIVLFATIGPAILAATTLRARTIADLKNLIYAIPLLGIVAWMGVWIVKGASPVRSGIHQKLAAIGDEFSPSDTIVAYDIGAVGYYTRAYIYDIAALVTPEAIGYHYKVRDILYDRHPPYFFTFATSENLELMEGDSLLRNDYRPVARFSPEGATLDELDAASQPAGWTQDYVLYRRKK